VYEGFAIPQAIRRVDIAGRDITQYLQLLLRKNGYHFYTSAEMEVVRLIKEMTCYVSQNPIKEEKEFVAGAFGAAFGAPNDKLRDEFVLPDGKVIKVRRS
jgi:centractin